AHEARGFEERDPHLAAVLEVEHRLRLRAAHLAQDDERTLVVTARPHAARLQEARTDRGAGLRIERELPRTSLAVEWRFDEAHAPRVSGRRRDAHLPERVRRE